MKLLAWLQSLFWGGKLKPYDTYLFDLIQPNGEIIPPVKEDKKSLYMPPTPQETRELLYRTMVIHQNIVDAKGNILVSNIPLKIMAIVDRIISNKDRYVSVAHQFPNPIRWYHVALIHLMEGELNFNTYLGNGQSIYKKTTIVPKGRGPFESFEDGAVDAIRIQGMDKIQDWSIGNTLYLLEGFNGYGYMKYHPEVNTPYLWSGTDQYKSGKYVTDGKFDKNVVSTQIGIAPVMASLLARINQTF